MKTHRISHPTKGTTSVNVGRYQTFSVEWSKEPNALPTVIPTNGWETFAKEVIAQGGTIRNMVWEAKTVTITAMAKGFKVSVEAKYDLHTLKVSAQGPTLEAAKAAFWNQWNLETRTKQVPSHLTLTGGNRYTLA